MLAHSYLLAVYFAFGRQGFKFRSAVLLMIAGFIAIEATWIHSTLSDISDPFIYRRCLSENVVVFVVPSVAVALVFLPLRALFSLNGRHERFSILHLLFITSLVAIAIETVRYNQFAKYLFDWSALGEFTVCNAILALSLYMALLADSGYLRLLGTANAIATLGFQTHSKTSNSFWEYVRVLLPWFIYVPFSYFLRSHLSPEGSIAKINDGNQARDKEY